MIRGRRQIGQVSEHLCGCRCHNWVRAIFCPILSCSIASWELVVVSVCCSVGAGCVSDLGSGVSSGSVGGVHGSIGVGLIYSGGGVHGCVGVGCILPKELGVGVGDSAHGSVGAGCSAGVSGAVLVKELGVGGKNQFLSLHLHPPAPRPHCFKTVVENRINVQRLNICWKTFGNLDKNISKY